MHDLLQNLHLWIDHAGWNYVARKAAGAGGPGCGTNASRGRVLDIEQGIGRFPLDIGLREIAIDLRLRRNPVALDPVGRSGRVVLVGDKEEQLILIAIEVAGPVDWAANCPAGGVVPVTGASDKWG